MTVAEVMDISATVVAVQSSLMDEFRLTLPIAGCSHTGSVKKLRQNTEVVSDTGQHGLHLFFYCVQNDFDEQCDSDEVFAMSETS